MKNHELLVVRGDTLSGGEATLSHFFFGGKPLKLTAGQAVEFKRALGLELPVVAIMVYGNGVVVRWTGFNFDPIVKRTAAVLGHYCSWSDAPRISYPDLADMPRLCRQWNVPLPR